MQTNTEENENVCIDTWNILDQSVSNESNSNVNICNHIWNQIDVTAALSAVEHQTWECFGEIQSIKELMFITDTLIAAVHLEKIKQMNNLSLIPEKVSCLHKT